MRFRNYFTAHLALQVLVGIGVAEASDSFSLFTYRGTLYCGVNGISPDGKIAYGWVNRKAEDYGAMIPAWFDGDWHLTPVFPPLSPGFLAISADNRTFLGTDYSKATSWILSDGVITPLTKPDWAYHAKGFAISADGRVILGRMLDRHSIKSYYLWTDNVPSQLPVPANTGYILLAGLSADGRIAIGNARLFPPISDVPVVWRDGSLSVPTFSDYTTVQFGGISADGQTMFGSAIRSNQTSLGPFPVWIRDGKITEFGRPTSYPYGETRVLGISADRSLAFGTADEVPQFWDKNGYSYDQDTLLRALNLVPDSVKDIQINSMSSDGRRLVGDAYVPDNRYFRPFLLNFESRNWPNIVNRLKMPPSVYYNDKCTAYVRLSRPAPRGGIHVLLESPDPDLKFPRDVVVPSGKLTAPFIVTAAPATIESFYRKTSIKATSPWNVVNTVFPIYNLQPVLSLSDTVVTAEQRFTGAVTCREYPSNSQGFEIFSSSPAVTPDYRKSYINQGSTFGLTAHPVTQRTVVKITVKFNTFTLTQRVVVTP